MEVKKIYLTLVVVIAVSMWAIVSLLENSMGL